MEPRGKDSDAVWSRALWAHADALRQIQGGFMDQLGLGPEPTPSRVALRAPHVELLAYQEPRTDRAVVLIVPAPIKAAYIWDLAPDASAVQHCLAEDLQVYLMAWQPPRPDDTQTGLAEYADSAILNCLQAIAAETNQPKVILAGHSLGGTLAAIFAALHSDLLHGLVELEGPIEFSTQGGRLERAAAKAPGAAAVTELLGNVPGSFLDFASGFADPLSFASEPWMDWVESCLFPRARRTYLLVRRWTLDETPLPQRLFEEVVDQLYRENRFAEGTLTVGDRRADPRALTVPILAVLDRRSHVVPSRSVEAYADRTASSEVQVLDYPGDFGVMLQHVGVLVGENAHALVWPQIVQWMRRFAPPAH